jgi:hypothetical protein
MFIGNSPNMTLGTKSYPVLRMCGQRRFSSGTRARRIIFVIELLQFEIHIARLHGTWINRVCGLPLCHLPRAIGCDRLRFYDKSRSRRFGTPQGSAP